MYKGNKGIQAERELEAKAKQALRTSVYIQITVKRNLHKEFCTIDYTNKPVLRSGRKASNISMIQALNFETSSTGKH
jgi:hypothetical protein